MPALAEDPLTHLVQEQTAVLLDGLDGFERSDGRADDAVRRPSRLPGWSVGHVLTHLARNADGLANVLTSAATGESVPMYASQQVRDDDIAAGSGRSTAALVADVRASAARLQRLVEASPDDVLRTKVPDGRGHEVAVHVVPWLRAREVVLHHVDLGLGFDLGRAPAAFLRRAVEECAEKFQPVSPGADVTAQLADGSAVEVRIGDGAVDVRGPAGAVLGWLTGRRDGAGLDVDGRLPALPAWG